MSATTDFDFWFTMGSTYTCLTALRLPQVVGTAGVKIRWRPFNLRTILQEMKHIPFADKPAKCAYMWRDIERRAAMYGLSVRVPAPYPLKENALANKIAVIGMHEGWGKDFVPLVSERPRERKRAQCLRKPARMQPRSRARP